MWWLTDHEEPTRQGSRHRQNAPYQRMRTADGYLMIGAAGESIWVRCAEALGRKERCDHSLNAKGNFSLGLRWSSRRLVRGHDCPMVRLEGEWSAG